MPRLFATPADKGIDALPGQDLPSERLRVANHEGEAATSCPLPDVLPGHWSSGEGREMAEHYATLKRSDIGHSDLSDFQLANAVYLASRQDLDLIVYQTSAKERIRWLSVQLALALAKAGA